MENPNKNTVITIRIIIILALFFINILTTKSQVPVVFRYDDYCVTFRYDDYCASYDEKRLFVDSKIMEIHKKYDVPIVLGVIPLGPDASLIQDSLRLDMLKKYINAGTIEVAMHGHSHINLVNDGENSEFRGLPRGIQQELITTAKGALEYWLNQEINIFIPPWNTYDEITLQILVEEDFNILSAGYNGGPEPNIISIPATVWSLPEFKQKIDRAINNEYLPKIVFLIHQYDFFESGNKGASFSLDEYDAIIEFVAKNPHFKTVNFSQFAIDPDLSKRLSDQWSRQYLISESLRGNINRLIPGTVNTYVQRAMFFLGDRLGFSNLVVVIYGALFLAGFSLMVIVMYIAKGYYTLWRVIGVLGVILSMILIRDFIPSDTNILITMASSAKFLLFPVSSGFLLASIFLPGMKFGRNPNNFYTK